MQAAGRAHQRGRHDDAAAAAHGSDGHPRAAQGAAAAAQVAAGHGGHIPASRGSSGSGYSWPGEVPAAGHRRRRWPPPLPLGWKVWPGLPAHLRPACLCTRSRRSIWMLLRGAGAPASCTGRCWALRPGRAGRAGAARAPGRCCTSRMSLLFSCRLPGPLLRTCKEGLHWLPTMCSRRAGLQLKLVSVIRTARRGGSGRGAGPMRSHASAGGVWG